MKHFLFALLAFFSLSLMAAVNLNTATQAELESLKGIGPAKAKSIIEYRSKNGPFKSVDDLANISGIKKATIDKFRADVVVSGGGAAPAAKPAAAPAAAPAAPAPATAPAAKK